MCTQLFIAALFIAVQAGNNPNFHHLEIFLIRPKNFKEKKRPGLIGKPKIMCFSLTT
jgi:hypothetical protein